MFPGVLHCGGGTAPNSFDLLTPLVNWVENGAAPTKVTATQSNAGTIVRTRPVFPYPTVARYTGTGNINDATNFTAATPQHPTQDHFPWLGRFEGDHR
jgi:feruloyl esterase